MYVLVCSSTFAPGQFRLQLLKIFAQISFLRLKLLDTLPLLIVQKPRPKVPEFAVYLLHPSGQPLNLGGQIVVRVLRSQSLTTNAL